MPIACQGLPTALGLNGEEWFSLVTPTIGKVIPDLLLGRLLTVEAHAPALTHVEASVVSLVHSEPEFMPEDILSQIFLPEATATRTFRNLEKKGALERTPSGGFRVNQNLAATRMEIVAVELKLRRWRAACNQGVSYLPFADRAYAVLDGNQLKITDEIHSTFQRSGVGLVLQFGYEFKVVIQSSADRVMTCDRLIAAQKLARVALT